MLSIGWQEAETQTTDPIATYLRAIANNPLPFVQSLTMYSPTLQTVILDLSIELDFNVTAWKVMRSNRGMSILGPNWNFFKVMFREGMSKRDWWRKSVIGFC